MSDDQKNDRLLRDAGAKVLGNLHPDWTLERLLCHPRTAIAFCKAVRREFTGAARMRDDEILWALLNQRKQGNLRHAKGAA